MLMQISVITYNKTPAYDITLLEYTSIYSAIKTRLSINLWIRLVLVSLTSGSDTD